MDPTARILRLLSLLQTYRHWGGEELSERLEVSPRTLRRDVERLRELGYPVDTTRGSHGGYRLSAGAQLPPLLLDDEEAVAIAVGLRTATSGVTGIEETSLRALAKLQQVLPAKLRRRVDAIAGAATAESWSDGQTVDADVLVAIAQACRGSEQLRFRYTAGDGSQTQRLVEPHQLVSRYRRWYLLAWDVQRGDWRTFRADRVEQPFANGVRAAPRELPAEDAAAFLAQSLRSRPREFFALLRVVSGTVPPWLGTVEDGHVRVTGDRPGWLAMSLAMLDAEVELVDCSEQVREELAVRQERLAALSAP